MGIECDCVPRVASGFGGGIGKQGEVCGALTGGVMVIGLLKGRQAAQDSDAKQATYVLAAEFVRKFQDENGALNCRDLLQLDIADDGDMRTYREKDMKDHVCTLAVRNAIRILFELVEPSP